MNTVVQLYTLLASVASFLKELRSFDFTKKRQNHSLDSKVIFTICVVEKYEKFGLMEQEMLKGI